jgi:acyl-CoA synthetase (AMP-forming)/AMP-acid ligase II
VSPPPAVGTLGELVAARARDLGGRAAFHFVRGEGTPATLTYRDLHARVTRLAAGLCDLAPDGGRAILLLPSGLEFVEALLACHSAGLVPVPIQPPHGAQAPLRLGEIIKDADPQIGLTCRAFLARVRRHAAEAPAFAACPWHCVEDISAPAECRRPSTDPDALALLQYTSGSTGQPKGVMLTHRNVLCNAAQVHVAFGEPSHGIDRMVCWLPPFHDMGLMSGVIGPIYSGIEAVLMSPLSVAQRPARWLDAISGYGATLSGAPNFAYDQCVSRIHEEERSALRLSSWRVAFCGAEPIRAETLDAFARAYERCGFRPSAFLPSYGLAEATVAVSASREEAPVRMSVEPDALQTGAIVETGAAGRAIVGCGRLLRGVRAAVVDERGRECRPDRVGEIWVAGGNVGLGYWRQPDLTRATFGAVLAGTGEGPFLRTGDLGFIRDGRLFVTGRLKDVIIIRGLNYYPHDIEATAQRGAASVAAGAAAAVAIDHADGERLVIILEVRRRARADCSGACDAIRAAVAQEHGIAPWAVVLVEQGSLPKTTSGKIRRGACRALFAGGDLVAIDGWCADPAAWPAGLVSASPRSS